MYKSWKQAWRAILSCRSLKSQILSLCRLKAHVNQLQVLEESLFLAWVSELVCVWLHRQVQNTLLKSLQATHAREAIKRYCSCPSSRLLQVETIPKSPPKRTRWWCLVWRCISLQRRRRTQPDKGCIAAAVVGTTKHPQGWDGSKMQCNSIQRLHWPRVQRWNTGQSLWQIITELNFTTEWSKPVRSPSLLNHEMKRWDQIQLRQDYINSSGPKIRRINSKSGKRKCNRW